MAEYPSRIEPCFPTIEGCYPRLTTELASELIEKTAVISAKFSKRTAISLASLSCRMNCYYSNLIEGHSTTLAEMESALKEEFSDDKGIRNMQLEIRALTRLQATVDALSFKGELPSPTSIEFITDLHKCFYNDVPEDLLVVGDTRIIPGKFRDRPVKVGHHFPPEPESLEAFMVYFMRQFNLTNMSKLSRVIVIPAAHHRLAYIHPFLDGNGRVCRLMSHCMAMYSGIGAGGIWSIARGLAKGKDGVMYMEMMQAADSPRQGDLDGRGNLSRKELIEFTNWFLAVCIDQVDFMSSLYDFEGLGKRMEQYIMDKRLHTDSIKILKGLLTHGELTRGDACGLTGFKDRQARNILYALLEDGILYSDSPRGKVTLQFSLVSLDTLFPNLV